MSADEDAVAEILAAWRAAAERGEREEPEAVVHRHPEHEAALRRGFAALALLDRAVAAANGTAEDAADAADEMPAPSSTTLGDFRLLREVGRGAMGVVYEAEQVSMRRRVALKVLYPSVTLSPKAVERFQREARAAGRLHHTSIVSVHGMGSESGTWFYAMEWVDGHPLSQALADRRRIEGVPDQGRASASSSATAISTTNGRREEYERVARAFAGLADALALAHATGIVHRDVKPSNILLDAAGTLKLLDFGLARSEEGETTMTATGDVVGTPQYMSPEQARGTKADARSDVYSLGATLYEVLTARPPIEGRDVGDVLRKILAKEPPPPRTVERRIPRDLETIVLKALEKEPSRRYASAADFARDLTLFAEGAAIRAKRIGPVGRAWRGVRRHRLRTALVASVVVLGAATTAFAIRHADEDRRRVDAEYDAFIEEARTVFLSRAIPDAQAAWHERPVDDDGGRQLLEAATRKEPDRPEAYLLLAVSRSGPLPLALAWLEEAKARGLSPTTYRIGRALVLRMHGKLDEARADSAIEVSSAVDSAMAAILLLASGRRREAIALASHALSQSRSAGASSPTALEVRARAREAEGDLEGAIEDFSAIRCERTFTAVYFDIRIATLWRKLRREARAKSQFEHSLARVRESATKHDWMALANACAEVGEFAWVDAVCSEALGKYPDSADLWKLRANARYTLGDPGASLCDADAAIRLDPRRADLHVRRARALIGVGRTEEAVLECRLARSVDADPRDAADAAGLLGFCGELGESITALRQAAARWPDDHSVWHNLAELLFHAHDSTSPGETRAALDRAIALDPLCADARARRVDVLTGVGRTDEALEDADAAIALLPERGARPVYCAKSATLVGLGRLRDALAAIERAIDSDPNGFYWPVATLHANHGYVLGRLGRWEDAVSAYSLAIELAPDGPARSSARIARAMFLRKLGRFEESLADLDAVNPQDSSLPFLIPGSRSATLAGLKRAEEARRVVDDLGARFPDVLVVTLGRVEVLRTLGAADEARRTAVDALARLSESADGKDVAWLAAIAGDVDRARQAIGSAPPDASVDADDAYYRASICALIGDREAAFRWLELAADKGHRLGALDMNDPDLASLSSDPRLAALRDRMRVAPK